MTRHRYIPGTDPLAVTPYTPEERAELVRQVRAKTPDHVLASIRGTRRHAELRRVAKTETRKRVTDPSAPTTPVRVAVRLVALTGWTFAAAAWALTDITRRYVSQHVVRENWNRMYPRGRR